MRKTLAQFRREFWEAKASLVLTPLFFSGFLMLLLLFGAVNARTELSFVMQSSTQSSGAENATEENFVVLLQSGQLFAAHPDILTHGLAAIFTLFTALFLLVLFAYLSGALYNDRQDKSILFWKSLPLTDTRDVITKLATAVLAAPLCYGAAALVTCAFYLLVLFAYMGLVLDLPPPGVGQISQAYASAGIGYVLGWLFAAAWLLPVFCWVLMVSAAAKKSPMLIAFGVPLILILLEAWIFGGFDLARTIAYSIKSAAIEFQLLMHSPASAGEALSRTGSLPFLGGLTLSIVFVATSIYLRKHRWEI